MRPASRIVNTSSTPTVMIHKMGIQAAKITTPPAPINDPAPIAAPPHVAAHTLAAVGMIAPPAVATVPDPRATQNPDLRRRCPQHALYNKPHRVQSVHSRA